MCDIKPGLSSSLKEALKSPKEETKFTCGSDCCPRCACASARPVPATSPACTPVDNLKDYMKVVL